MNEIKLFEELVALTKDSEVFYKQEFKLDGKIYWIFNYRLASYSDFQLPSAKWARGTMFEVDSNGNLIHLASLPMPKFFNAGENPETIGLDLNDIAWIEVKSDGSLMSTYIHDGKLRLKSKGSLFSEQAIDAMVWLDRPENANLKYSLLSFASCGFTVNLEWVAPWNRIVLGYKEPKLIVLNVMDHLDIDWFNIDREAAAFFAGIFQELIDKMNPLVDVGQSSKKEFAESIPSMQDDIEGFILVMKSGQRVKVKTDKYISLHHAKDSINNPRRLFECVLDEATDDLRSMFATDAVATQAIDEMEKLTQHLYNHLVSTVEKFYTENLSLDRKSYAVKGQADLNSMEFGLAMNLYVGRKNDYKTFMKSRYKEFGIRDNVTGKE